MKVAPLGAVAEIVMGQSPPGSSYNASGEGFPLLNGPSEFTLEGPVAVQWTTDPKRFAEPGDILFCVRGATAGRMNWSNGRYCIGRGLAAIRPGPLADPRYIRRLLDSWYRRIQAAASGSTFINISKKDLNGLAIPLPGIEEQRRIAAVLDAADDLRTKRRQTLAKLDTLTQAIFIDMFGDPLRCADVERLGDVVTFIGGGTPSKAVAEYYEGENCWATSKDMKSPFLDDTQDHVTDEGIAKSATKLVPRGSVLVVVKSKVLAHRLPVSITRVRTCFGQDLKAVPPTPGYPAEFIAESFRAAERWLLARARGVNTEGLTLVELRRVPIPRSSPHQRIQFASIVRGVEAAQSQSLAHLSEADILFASLQQRAFAGEL